MGQAGATGVVAMAVMQAGRDHRGPSGVGLQDEQPWGTLLSACPPAASCHPLPELTVL
jgi:hypothetical protein